MTPASERLKRSAGDATNRAPMRLLHLRRTRDGLMCALVLSQLAYSWMFSGVSVPNERTRAYLTIAIVDDGSVTIDAPIARFGKVFDLARFGDHYFTDKAPGLSFLAVPVYAFARLFKPASAFDVVDVIDLARTWLMLPIGLLAFIVLRGLLRALRISEPVVDVCSLGFVLGSSMLHYAGAFYGHALVALLVLASLRCLVAAGVFANEPRSSNQRRAMLLMAAGAFAGAMGLTEYQAIVLAVLFALPIALAPRATRVRDIAFYALGGAPFALVLLVYNQHAFGGAFALSYQHLVGASLQTLHAEGLMGATHPQWNALEGILWSEHRGLLITSPLLGLGLLGLALGPRWMPRTLWLTFVLCVLYFVLIVASSSVWYGGWSFGPRLLIPIMGVCAIAAAFVLDAWRDSRIAQVVFRAAAISGVFYQAAVHATFAELPPTFLRPLPDSVLPLWHAQLFAPNLACKVWPLGSINALPLVVLLACTVIVLACRGLAGRRWLGCVAFGCAALTWLVLATRSPSIDAREQGGWVRRVQTWQASETRCHG